MTPEPAGKTVADYPRAAVRTPGSLRTALAGRGPFAAPMFRRHATAVFVVR